MQERKKNALFIGRRLRYGQLGYWSNCFSLAALLNPKSLKFHALFTNVFVVYLLLFQQYPLGLFIGCMILTLKNKTPFLVEYGLRQGWWIHFKQDVVSLPYRASEAC